jgi:DNA-binding protein YbaB
MTDDFERRIDDARRRLEQLRADARVPGGDAAQPAPDRPSANATSARAGDGAVEAFAASGRLQGITFAPQVMRLGDDEIARLLTEAVNQALQRSRAEMLAGVEDGVPSLAGLETSVEQVRDQGERAMYEIQAALNGAIAKVGDRTGLSGDTGSQGLDQLLGTLFDTLRVAQGAGAPGEATPEGHGSDDEGHVSARVNDGGTVTEFAFGPRAFRLPSVDLAVHTVAAVNAALDDAESARAALSAADLADLSRRVDEVRQASVRQMTQLTQSLTGIMSRIREP